MYNSIGHAKFVRFHDRAAMTESARGAMPISRRHAGTISCRQRYSENALMRRAEYRSIVRERIAHHR